MFAFYGTLPVLIGDVDMKIRNSAKAVIVQDGKILVIKKGSPEGDYFVLPGGGQEPSENLHATLTRECIEEIGEEVDVGDLLFIREYIGKNHERSTFDSQVHQIEYMFLSTLRAKNTNIKNGISPDVGQIGVEWLPLSELLQYRLYPQEMREHLMNYVRGEKLPVYLGDIN